MSRTKITIAAVLTHFSIAALAQKELPAELVLTTRIELEQTHLPHDVDFKTGPLAAAYDSLVLTAQRPAGAVFTKGCEVPEQALVSIPSAYSLADAFDVLTTSYTTHHWSIHDGVVNLLPKGKLPAVLDTLIGRFEWDTNETPGGSVGSLFQLSNVQHRFIELGITQAYGTGELQAAPCMFCVRSPPTGRKWKVENVTLLTALNRIAASYGNARWVYEEWTCGSKIFRFGAH
jgi:hypothetical protein